MKDSGTNGPAVSVHEKILLYRCNEDTSLMLDLIRLLLRYDIEGAAKLASSSEHKLGKLTLLADPEFLVTRGQVTYRIMMKETNVILLANAGKALASLVDTPLREVIEYTAEVGYGQVDPSSLGLYQRLEKHMKQLQITARHADLSPHFEVLAEIYRRNKRGGNKLIEALFDVVLEIVAHNPTEKHMRWLVGQIEDISDAHFARLDDTKRLEIVIGNNFQTAVEPALHWSSIYPNNRRLRKFFEVAVFGIESPMPKERVAGILEFCLAKYRTVTGYPSEDERNTKLAVDLVENVSHLILDKTPNDTQLKRASDALNQLIVLSKGRCVRAAIEIFGHLGGDFTEIDPTKPMFLRPDKWLHLLKPEHPARPETIMRLWIRLYAESAKEQAAKERAMEEHPDKLARFIAPERSDRGLFQHAKTRRVTA